MTAKKNTDVSTLPLVSQLMMQHMAHKCVGVCGACLYTKCFGREDCAVIASDKGRG
jgi:hypothetical protein